ncbi:unnamed protein product [Rotaria sp. Silwood1]|nr:unnamed protein product [Rotaria sp. Silwood1]CAF1320666.1 unnamed protein product [Rotaria sp. Silwood1]CAF3520371.1 unnamed protein product [Rotaria sp. Silwood1]CAF4506557.1 unnamed protein product [Rotaria sp. Silwood1]
MSIINIDELLVYYEHIWSNAIVSYPERPLRLVDIKRVVNDGQLVFVPSQEDLNYCTISYTWLTAKRNKNSQYLLEQVSPFTVEGLISALHVCHELGHEYLWIDALCIDQRRTSKEKQREIPNMGKYYRGASECVIFPDGLHLNADILPESKLPRWFYRSWTLQEFILSRKRTFIFNANARIVFGYNTVGGQITGHIIHTRFGQCISIDSYFLTWLLTLVPSIQTGPIPLKTDVSQWKEIKRESLFMLEVDCSRKSDILQRAMFRQSKYEEDKVYSILSVFDHVKIDVQYGIGLQEVLRRLATVVTNEELAYMLLTNWFSTNHSDTSSADISALPTFERQTSGFWFKMGEVCARCKYIRSEGVHISTKIMRCQLRITGICTNDLYGGLTITSDLDIQAIELTTSVGIIVAYGRCLYDASDLILVVIGEVQSIDSILTGPGHFPETPFYCLICEEKENKKLRKVGMCICVFDNIDENRALIQSNVLLG